MPRSALTALALSAACIAGEPVAPGAGGAWSGVHLPDADLRVLFIGNSLTAGNDLPGVVAALAGAADVSFAHATLARAGWSLEEHWAAGAADVIRDARPDVVVLQQGPSSLPESRTHLVHWAERFAPVIRDAGGVPALLMVWPDESRAAFFPDVRRSYADAAEAAGGLFIPGGQAWIEAWARDPALELWGPDRFHPSYTGTLIAAMATFAVVAGLDPAAIPDLPDDDAPESRMALLRTAVAAALE